MILFMKNSIPLTDGFRTSMIRVKHGNGLCGIHTTELMSCP